MPRTGITEEQILSAIEALQTRGENITKNTVRRELGDTGSFSTITSYLQGWRLKQSTPEQQNVLVPIPEAVQGLFAKAWSIAQAAAQAELTPQREALDQEAAALKTVLAQAQTENEEAIRVLELQMDHLQSQLIEAGLREQSSQARIAQLSEDLGYLRAKAEAAEARSQQAITERDAMISELELRLVASSGGPEGA